MLYIVISAGTSVGGRREGGVRGGRGGGGEVLSGRLQVLSGSTRQRRLPMPASQGCSAESRECAEWYGSSPVDHTATWDHLLFSN